MAKPRKVVPNTIKPPLVPSAWVVAVDGLNAKEFAAAKRGQYRALDLLTKDGSSVTLSTKIQDLVKCLENLDTVTVKRTNSLSAADESVSVAPDDALVVFAVTGDGNWADFYNEPQKLDDGFPLPAQSAGDNVVPCGLACFSANAKTRIDYREWLVDKTYPGEGVITAAQLAEEIMSKVGEKPKFGA